MADLDPDKHREQAVLARSARGAVQYGEDLVERQKKLGIDDLLKTDALPWAIKKVMKAYPAGWRGSPKAFLKLVRKALPWRMRWHQTVPKDREQMAERLVDVAPLLAAIGLDVVRSMPREIIIQWREWEG